MKALLNETKEWVDITYYFDNQYSIDKKRIFDSDVIRIVDDERIKYPELCECGYCGKRCFTAKEYEQHIQEEKALAKKVCKGCFWHHVYRETSTKEELKNIVFKPDGSEVHTKTLVTTVNFTEKGCSYNDHDWNKTCSCTHEAHSYYKKRTFEHSYFVKHPYGKLFDSYEVRPTNVAGSWFLNVNPKTLEWELYNSRERIQGRFNVNDHSLSHSPTENKTLQKAFNIAYDVIKRIMREVREYNEFVSDSRNYTNPNGTILDVVTINGVIKTRPNVIKTEWLG